MLMISLDNIPFAIRLATVRAARSLTQADVSDRTGIDRSIISRYERGLMPSKNHLQLIEDALQISFDDPQVEEAITRLAGLSDREMKK